MPLREDLRSFFIAEYNRFMAGLERLTRGEEATFRDDGRRAREVRGEPVVVRIPRWDDVVHITPRVAVSGDERVAHFRARREGVPSPLSDQKQQELERRRGIATAIRDAAQPAAARSFGAVLTALDNVQDFASTVSSAGRLVYWATLSAGARGLELSAAEIERLRIRAEIFRRGPAARSLAAFGARVRAARFAPGLLAKRLLPGIGWILGISDLINLLAFMGIVALPTYMAACFGAREALAAGVPALVFGRGLKAIMGGLHGLNPFSRRARLKRRIRVASRLPGLGAAIEVLQTTDQLWGVGISFGAIVGAVFGTAFGLERALRGEIVVPRTPPEAYRMHTLLAPRLAGLSLRDIEERERAAAILAEGPMLLSQPGVIGLELWIESLVMYAAALDLTRDFLAGLPWQGIVGDNGALGLTLPSVVPKWDPGYQAEGEDLGADFSNWTLPGTPHELTEQDIFTLGTVTVPSALRAVLEPTRDTTTGAFIGATVDRIFNQLYLLLEEDPDLLDYELTPDFRVLEALAESNRLVNVSDDPNQIFDFWQAATAAVDGTDRRSLLPEELDELARQAGIQLIPLLPVGLARIEQ